MGFTSRLKEPSTWAGVAVLGMVMGLNPAAMQAVGAVAAVLSPFFHQDGGVIAQTIFGLATLGGAGAAVAMPEAKHAPSAVQSAAPDA